MKKFVCSNEMKKLFKKDYEPLFGFSEDYVKKAIADDLNRINANRMGEYSKLKKENIKLGDEVFYSGENNTDGKDILEISYISDYGNFIVDGTYFLDKNGVVEHG